MLSTPTSAPPDAASPVCHRTDANRWRNVGIFLAVVAAFHLSLDWLLPARDLGGVSDKFVYFARHKDEFDAVFVGSSHVYRQIVPTVFDAQVSAATGQPIRSYNLGVPSMFLPESLYVIDRIIAQRPARLRWMFIELEHPLPRLEEHAGLVQREVYWHGWRETMLMCVNILGTPHVRFRERLLMLAHQGALFGRCQAHVGGAYEWLAQRQSSTTPTDPASDTADSAGFTPYRNTLGQGTNPGKNAKADTKKFLADTASLRNGRARSLSPPASSPLRWILLEKVRALRALGIEPVFVIAPITTAEEEFLTLSRQGVLPTLFAFNDPVAYPELYEVNMRADTTHLNAPGAMLFTRLLAGKFAEHRLDETRVR